MRESTEPFFRYPWVQKRLRMTLSEASMKLDESPGIIEAEEALTLSDTSLISNEAMIQKIIDLDYAAYRRQRPEL